MAELKWTNVNSEALNDASKLAGNALIQQAGLVGNIFDTGSNFLANMQAKRDQAEQNLKDYRTQLAINRMNQAESLEELQALRQQGLGTNEYSHMLGDMDLEKYNQAVSTWNKDTLTRNESKDSLLDLTSEGKQALSTYYSHMEKGDIEGAIKVLNNSNLSVNTKNKIHTEVLEQLNKNKEFDYKVNNDYAQSMGQIATLKGQYAQAIEKLNNIKNNSNDPNIQLTTEYKETYQQAELLKNQIIQQEAVADSRFAPLGRAVIKTDFNTLGVTPVVPTSESQSAQGTLNEPTTKENNSFDEKTKQVTTSSNDSAMTVDSKGQPRFDLTKPLPPLNPAAKSFLSNYSDKEGNFDFNQVSQEYNKAKDKVTQNKLLMDMAVSFGIDTSNSNAMSMLRDALVNPTKVKEAISNYSSIFNDQKKSEIARAVYGNNVTNQANEADISSITSAVDLIGSKSFYLPKFDGNSYQFSTASVKGEKLKETLSDFKKLIDSSYHQGMFDNWGVRSSIEKALNRGIPPAFIMALFDNAVLAYNDKATSAIDIPSFTWSKDYLDDVFLNVLDGISSGSNVENLLAESQKLNLNYDENLKDNQVASISAVRDYINGSYATKLGGQANLQEVDKQFGNSILGSDNKDKIVESDTVLRQLKSSSSEPTELRNKAQEMIIANSGTVNKQAEELLARADAIEKEELSKLVPHISKLVKYADEIKNTLAKSTNKNEKAELARNLKIIEQKIAKIESLQQ